MGLNTKRPLPTVIESACIQYKQETDFVQVLNPNTNAWVDWEKTNVISEPSTITVTTDNMDGYAVTCKIGDENYTSTFAGGSVTFKVNTSGTATITAGGITKTVTISEGGSATVNISRPSALLKFTTENLNGELITVSVGGETYTGTFVNGTCNIIVYTFGTATVTCGEVTETISIASGGSYTVDLTEITRVYFVENGVTKNGATTDSSGDLSVTNRDGYIGVNANAYYVRYLKIPKNDLLSGKTLTVEFSDVDHSPIKSRFIYDNTNSYIELTVNEHIHSVVLTETMFTSTNTVQYIGVGKPRSSGSSYAELRIVNVYVE